MLGLCAGRYGRQQPPHWQEPPFWQPQEQPEPHEQAAAVDAVAGRFAMECLLGSRDSFHTHRCPSMGNPPPPGRQRGAGGRNRERPTTAGAPRQVASGSGSGANSSACSPVTRYTTRRAIDTA
ncbi:hypothetical protein GCM10010417_12110 [Streptomyces carpaticus]